MTYTIKQILEMSKMGQEVVISGWVRAHRKQQLFSFIEVNDGSMHDSIQILAGKELSNMDEVSHLTAGCSVTVKGLLVESPAKGQDYEIQAKEITILGMVESPESYPAALKRHTLEHWREHAHLRQRSNLASAIARVRHHSLKAIHDFFDSEGYLWCATPLLTSSDCEGAGEMFKVSTLDFENIPMTKDGKVDYSKDFFGKPTSLTVSGQLNAEAYACSLTKVYTCGPTFRAENSNTSRHLSEFWMIEPEVAFANMTDAIALSERMLKHVISYVMEKCPAELKFFDSFVDKTCLTRLTEFVKSDFAVCDYTDAVEILISSKHKFEIPVTWGMDLGSEHERYLAEVHFKSPVAITNYPKDIKSFYMRGNDDGKTVAAFDVLAPGVGEIIGGSQREERLEVLESRMLEVGLSPEDYSWYLDLRRYGTVPHSGFGLGFERLISYITGVSNVRDTIPFPRTPNSIDF